MINKATRKQASQIAKLHKQAITEGFLPRLGLGFLTSLYRFLIKTEIVIVYEEDGELLGFVSGAVSSKGMMHRFLYSSPGGILKVMLALVKKPTLIGSLLETYRAPTLTEPGILSGSVTILDPSALKKAIPETELLSMSVSPLAQKNGIGKALLNGLEEELIKHHITSYKVIAGDKLIETNQFYKRNGFVLVKQITIHGNEVSNVYVKAL